MNHAESKTLKITRTPIMGRILDVDRMTPILTYGHYKISRFNTFFFNTWRRSRALYFTFVGTTQSLIVKIDAVSQVIQVSMDLELAS